VQINSKSVWKDRIKTLLTPAAIWRIGLVQSFAKEWSATDQGQRYLPGNITKGAVDDPERGLLSSIGAGKVQEHKQCRTCMIFM
jgi:hypothetical protein